VIGEHLRQRADVLHAWYDKLVAHPEDLAHLISREMANRFQGPRRGQVRVLRPGRGCTYRGPGSGSRSDGRSGAASFHSQLRLAGLMLFVEA
jgi:hypothetical protein